MAAITLAMAQAKLTMWMEADDALSTGQEYQIDVSGTRRKVVRADASMIQQRINYWSTMVNRLSSRGTTAPSVRSFIPSDR